jgi:hypothetical protein
VADSINVANNKAKASSMINPINYLYKYHGIPFTKLHWRYASTYEIGKIINSLKSKNSSGYDEIPNRITKLSSPFIISPLTHICNTALSSGVFSDRLKSMLQLNPSFKKAVNRISLTADQYLY